MIHKNKVMEFRKMAAIIIIVILTISGCSTGQDNKNTNTNSDKPVTEEKGPFYFHDETGSSYSFKLDDKYFYSYSGKGWDKTFLKGVNIGAEKPGYFPGELAITKEEYLRWFKYISEMNANTIRVYTLLKPEFYEALYEYNRSVDDPLFLIQEVWLNEEDMANIMDAQNEKLKGNFINDTRNVIDALHGNADIEVKPGNAGGKYSYDVSCYVAGLMLGIEWPPDFVIETEAKNSDKSHYDGEYLYTMEDSTPFEAFLCETGDKAIDYEMQKYKTQRPISFVNWPTTDPLAHPNEPLKDEDAATVNTEHIKSKQKYKAGLFATYHIYPYYPDFMNYQHEYASFKDEDGSINTYKAYLRDLRKIHSVPVLVGEFGVPASRGMTHVNIHTGFNQGNIDERAQGIMDAKMLDDIVKEGYAGGIVFTWQDEWFKRTWNTMDLDIPDRRPFWSNIQTNEQNFGLLSFDPGASDTCILDGKEDDWKGVDPITWDGQYKLYAKSDERYLYIKVNAMDFDINKDKLFVPIDIKQGQGNMVSKEDGLAFQRPADFLIVIDGTANSRIKVDSYYDPFYYMYAIQLKMLDRDGRYETNNSGNFDKINLCLNRPLYLPQDKKQLPLQYYETGKLTFGTSDSGSKDYNSLSDFYANNGVIEIRIPWQMLNVMDPSSRMIMDDLYATNGIKPIKTEGIYLGMVRMKDGAKTVDLPMKIYTWSEWDTPQYHERLKQSYYIMKDAFSKIVQ